MASALITGSFLMVLVAVLVVWWESERTSQSTRARIFKHWDESIAFNNVLLKALARAHCENCGGELVPELKRMMEEKGMDA